MVLHPRDIKGLVGAVRAVEAILFKKKLLAAFFPLILNYYYRIIVCA